MRFIFILYFIAFSISADFTFAEIQGAYLIQSDMGLKVSVFRKSEQKPDKGYLLIEGSGTEWDERAIEVDVKSNSSSNVDYNINWNNRPYTMLAGRSGSFTLSIPKPFKEFSGLHKPYRDEKDIDIAKLEALFKK